MRIDFEQALPRFASRLRGYRGPARMRGVTLIELMTVVAVLAIVSSIAVASYRRYLIRTNRTDATGALLRVQVAEEKYFLQNNVYTDDISKLGFGSATTPNGYYSVSVAAGSSGNLNTSFTATATPLNKQLSEDTSCQALTIDDKGQRGSTPGATSTCWK